MGDHSNNPTTHIEPDWLALTLTPEDERARVVEAVRARLAEPDETRIDLKPLNPMKFDAGKTRVDLLPTIPLFAVASVFGFGARKYAQNSWRSKDHEAVSWMRTYGSILSHLFLWAAGQDRDAESGMPHLWHAGTQIMILIEHVETGSGTDDRHHNEPRHVEDLRATPNTEETDRD